MVNSLGKLFIITGMVLFLLGFILVFVEKIPLVGRLPGDILVKKGSFSFYFPLTTSIIASLLISFLFWVFKSK